LITTLRTKILIVLLIIFALIGGMTYVIHNQVLTPSFLELERQHVNDNILRVRHAIENELLHLSTFVNDWSAWDDTYAYIVDHNKEYEQSNLPISTFTINRLNLMLFLDHAGNTVWKKTLADDFDTEITIKPFDQDSFSGDFPLLQYTSGTGPIEEQHTTGLLMTSAGPMLCSARPILDSNDQGPSRGTLVMGRLLNEEMVTKLTHLTTVDFQVKPVTSTTAPSSMDAEKPSMEQIRYKAQGDILSASSLYPDLDGDAALEITVRENRDILNQGLKTLRMSLTLTFAGIAVALCLMLLMLQKAVVTPVNMLTSKLLARRENHEPWSALETKACITVEILQLADEFNQLIENLDKRTEQLSEANFTLMTEAKKLKEAQHNLKNLDKLKSEFISTAAHELRTPLASIMGFTELLSGRDEYSCFNEQQKQEFLNEIYENTERLTKIVDDILDISRIEAGVSIPLDKAAVSIETLLKKAINNFRMRVNHRLSLQIASDIPEQLNIDAHRINQVLENLLSNAIKYSPKESDISLNAELDGRYCKITVADQGKGMTEEQLNHVFDKFYRADATNTAVRGLGLGMSIVKQIIEDHGGSIWVDSSPGDGTQVYFTLPLE